MIETVQQYRVWKRQAELCGPDSIRAAYETIEALREVARAADSLLMLLGALGAFGSLAESGPDADQLKTKVDSLADWLLEESS